MLGPFLYEPVGYGNEVIITVIEVIYIYAVLIHALCAKLDIVLGLDLPLCLLDLVASPCKTLVICSPEGMHRIPRSNIHVGGVVPVLNQKCPSCIPSPECGIPCQLTLDVWLQPVYQPFIGCSQGTDNKAFFLVILFPRVSGVSV